jgi:deoxyadenosine/deoxycytidine kinase
MQDLQEIQGIQSSPIPSKEIKHFYSMKVVIDGNIGSGKTTQLDLLEKIGYKVRREPIDEWPLEEFYKDQSRWAFYFHMVILQTLRPLRIKDTVIYERSLLSSRWVFWPVLLKKGLVTREEDETYSKFYDQYSWLPDLYIFLSKTPELAWEHIQARHQAGDSGITKEYWLELAKEYQNLIKNVPCQVYVVNANRSVEEIHKEICRIISDHELRRIDPERDQVQTKGGRERRVPCPSFQHMCRLS